MRNGPCHHIIYSARMLVEYDLQLLTLLAIIVGAVKRPEVLLAYPDL